MSLGGARSRLRAGFRNRGLPTGGDDHDAYTFETPQRTALLLTAATAGLALPSGSAEAQGSHHPSAARVATPTVTITSKKAGPKLSVDRIRPGNTLFKVVRGGAGGSMQVLRLKKGYSFKKAFSDFGKAFGQTTDVQAVRRIDKNVIFYGGMPVPAKGDKPNIWGVDIDKAGKYFVLNLDKNTLAVLVAKGSHQHRALPVATGSPGHEDHHGRRATRSRPRRTTPARAG